MERNRATSYHQGMTPGQPWAPDPEAVDTTAMGRECVRMDADGAVRALRHSMEEISRTYATTTYHQERDLVFTIQRGLIAEVGTQAQVFNDYPLIRGPRRALSADLAVRDDGGNVLLAVEFKYEPDRRRIDITPGKIPVTAWAEIARDTERVRRFVDDGLVQRALAVLVDEDGRYDGRAPDLFSERLEWGHAGEPGSSATAWICRARHP